jgi:hypothetical protein
MNWFGLTAIAARNRHKERLGATIAYNIWNAGKVYVEIYRMLTSQIPRKQSNMELTQWDIWHGQVHTIYEKR